MPRMGQDLRCIQPFCIFQSYTPGSKVKRHCDSPLATMDERGYIRVCPYLLLLKAMVEQGAELTTVQKTVLESVGIRLNEN